MKNIINLPRPPSDDSLLSEICERLGKTFDETMDLAIASLRVRHVPHKQAEALGKKAQIMYIFGGIEAMLKTYDSEKKCRALATLAIRSLEVTELGYFLKEIQRIVELAATLPPEPKADEPTTVQP